MKILVTGGAGFIGSHIVDALIKEKHEVIVVDNLSTGKEENLNSQARFYQVDIRDRKKLEPIFQEEKPELICHQAAHASVGESTQDPIYDAEVNILGSINLFELCVKYQVKRVVFASTGGALYGNADVLPTSEDYPAKPISPYGVSKLSVEQYLHYYQNAYNLPYTVLRYANVYGERQDPFGEAGVVAVFSQKIISDEQPVINGDGLQTRDYVHVSDVAQANLLALESLPAQAGSENSNFFNVGTGLQVNVNQLFQSLVKISGKQVTEKHGSPRSGEQKTSALNCEKIKKALKWQFQVKLEEGLTQTYNWFLKNYAQR